MSATQIYALRSGLWTAPGHSSLSPGSLYNGPTPSALIQPGVDYQVGVEPFVDAGAVLTTILPNMAVPGTTLTSDSNGSIVVTTANTTLYRLYLPTGYVQVKADNCLVDQCNVGGYNETVQTANKGLVDGNNVNATNLKIRDTTLIPTIAFACWTGIMGHHWTATRVKIRNTVDGLGAYPPSGHTSDPMTILVDGVDGNELAYISPDLNHPSDSPVSHTHNDWFQIQGAPTGSSIEIRFSNMQGFQSHTVGDWQYSPASHNSRGGWNNNYPADQTTSCLMLTPNVSSIHGINMHNNWCDGGQIVVNGIGLSAADGGITLTGNKHGRNTVFNTSAYEIATSATSISASGNTYIDNGAAVPLVRS